MSNLKRTTLAKWLVDHGFEQLPGRKSGHVQYRHSSGVLVTLPGHGSLDLSKKHVGMIIRQLEEAGFDRERVRSELNAR